MIEMKENENTKCNKRNKDIILCKMYKNTNENVNINKEK